MNDRFEKIFDIAQKSFLSPELILVLILALQKSVHFRLQYTFFDNCIQCDAVFVLQDVKATYFLGICCENGWGIRLNEAMAATLYETAAAAGHAEAQYNLGVFYETGRGGKTQFESSTHNVRC